MYDIYALYDTMLIAQKKYSLFQGTLALNTDIQYWHLMLLSGYGVVYNRKLY